MTDHVTPDAPTRCGACDAPMLWNGKAWEHVPQPGIRIRSYDQGRQ